MADKPDGKPGQADSGLPGAFRRRLAAGEFAVTAEIGPPRGADTAPVARKAALLRGWVDAVNITDNQSAAVRLSSLAGSLAALRAGVEPIMQLTCRDRNRIALQSELLSASALGVPNVLIMTGDHPRHGDHADAKPVFDLDSTQLLKVATAMRDQGRLMSGGELKPPPSWFLGAVENPPASRRRPVRSRGRGQGHLPAGREDRGRRAVRADPVRLRRAGLRRLDGPRSATSAWTSAATSWPASARSGRTARSRTWPRFPA